MSYVTIKKSLDVELSARIGEKKMKAAFLLYLYFLNIREMG